MMPAHPDTLEELWGRLLSRKPDQIQAAYAQLSTSEKQAVITHLQRMATEDGWHFEQRKSAEVALQALLP